MISLSNPSHTNTAANAAATHAAANTAATAEDSAASAANLKEQIHDALFSDIVMGVYKPGSILHEKKLMERYGASRAPVREALIQLCSENVLRNIPKKGYEVTELSDKDMQDLIHYRISLECGFLQQNGHFIDDDLIRRLEEYNQLHQARSQEGMDSLGHWNSNIHFHLLLFSGYNNRYAYSKLLECMTVQTRYYAQKRSLRWHSPIFYDANGLHVAIVDYLKQKNYAMASNILKADIEDTTTI